MNVRLKNWIWISLGIAALTISLLSFSPDILIAQEKNLSPALVSLVEAERAFARLSVEKGVRASFLASFAEDGINFRPGPVNTRRDIESRPAPATPPPITLDWQPIFADISAGGDLGYTTGPYILTDQSPEKRPAQHGYYFSVWKKQADEKWKVAVDIGISTPAPAEGAAKSVFHADQKSSRRMETINSTHEAAREFLQKMENEFSQDASAKGLAFAYDARLAEESRLHFPGSFPVTGKNTIVEHLRKIPGAWSWETLKTDCANSLDLGWTMGRYENSGKDAGHFVRVWKRENGKWQIVATILNPLPK
ncbi:MAG: DUF4440 domain-containing protein [Acidobacteria bacterium]|nr:DUF4440 domain-containing protein [Acidobacteriota bacterium]